jgi:hypothetical protein
MSKQQNDRLTTIGENPLSTTNQMVEQSEPEVKQQHWQAATTAWLTTTRISE